MIKRKKLLSVAILVALAGTMSITGFCAAEDSSQDQSDPENKYVYDLGKIVVTGKKDKEILNPYITCGDISVITREDIENHNYSDISAVLKTVPGVLISTPGYHGGEYGYATYNTELSINGENNIVILVDGRRVDNDANSYAGTKARVNLDTLPGIDNIEQVEVIKGAGAAIYGSDAAGGVINIITRKGTKQPRTTVDMATGSWGSHKYSLTQTGSSEDGTLQYAASVSRQMNGDTQYKDAYVGDTKTYANTSYRNEHGSLNINKDFNKTHSLTIAYDHSYEKAHYPITAPDYRYIDSFYNGTMATIDPSTHKYTGLNSTVPGYRNIFLYDAWLGSYNESQTNNVDIKYVFDKTDENAESFFRVYKNYTHYNTVDYSNIWNVPYPYLNEYLLTITAAGNIHTDIEQVTGTTLQLAKHIGKQSITTGVEFRKSEWSGRTSTTNYQSTRDSYSLYAQDKIKISDKFVVTPGMNYSYYGDGKYKQTNVEAIGKITFSAYSNYDFDKDTNMYFSLSQIFKPATGLDLSRALTADPLQSEEGYNYNLGINKKIADDDMISFNYGNTDMSNAIARYSVLDTTTGKWVTKAVNAKREKKSFNTAYEHGFNSVWKAGISYSWVNENYHAKNTQQNPDGTNPDDLINAYRPRNVYRTHVSYDKDKWFGDLAYTIYSGNDTRYFTSSHFGVLDLALNYTITNATQVYFNFNNILNKAYETKAVAAYGPGALPECGRNFMLGVKHSF